MDFEANFHRSYIDVTAQATPPRYKPDTFFGSPNVPRQPVKGSVEGYQWLPRAMRPMDLYPHFIYQFFELYATPWEKQFSSLLKSGPGKFAPVVHHQRNQFGFPVIAHYGEVRAENVIAPKDAMPNESGIENRLSKLLANDVPVFVKEYTPRDPEGWRRLENGNVYHFTVLTNLEGQVMAQLGTRLSDDSIESADPFLYIATGEILLSVGAALAKRLIISLTRRLVARDVAGALAKDGANLIIRSKGKVDAKQMLEWEQAGGHGLSRHSWQLTRKKLWERIKGGKEIGAPRNLPGGGKSPDFRVWQGQNVGAASKWADEVTMHKAIGDIIHQNIQSIREVISRGGEWVGSRLRMGYKTGSGWVTTKGAESAAFWDETLNGVTIVIRRRVGKTGAEDWYVHTAFPDRAF